jgi:hypothetical protein
LLIVLDQDIAKGPESKRNRPDDTTAFKDGFGAQSLVQWWEDEEYCYRLQKARSSNEERDLKWGETQTSESHVGEQKEWCYCRAQISLR